MKTRSYSQTTVKLLFGASGNQCAFPRCTNPIIAPGTDLSDAAVMGQICHIYAFSTDGPRGKASLTAAEINAADNLILMCGYHHPLVDKQWETYPAELLKAWKKTHEAKFQQGTSESLKLQASMQQMGFLQTYSDQQIAAEIEAIRQGRFLNGYPARERAAALAERIERTELAGGSSEIRAEGLAWCARLLCQPETLDRARELLRKSKELAKTSEAQLAKAFIVATRDKDTALALLAPMNTPAARSAALRIVTNHEQAVGAIAWVESAGLTLNSFDSEGKFFHIANELASQRWEEAADHASQVTEADMIETPVLHHTVGMACLMPVVPIELRSLVLSQIPFDAASFPLAADTSALGYRRRAMKDFEAVAGFAVNVGATAASNHASDLALWLKLRDPQHNQQAMEELRESMRDPERSFRRLPFALQFGLKLDLPAIEREIDRRIALSGRATVDEAVARLAIAFMQGDPNATAEYIDRHRAQLFEHLHKGSLQTIEIEMLARGGQIQTARERLAQALAAGLGDYEQHHLSRIIAEAEGADPARERKEQYEQTGRLNDLQNLVILLEQQQSWQELLPFAERLFGITRALEDAFRVGKVLNEMERYAELLQFLQNNLPLVEQAIGLKTMLAWSLYRHGRFDEASLLLRELAATRDDANDRALRVNLAIASGRWDELATHCASEWDKRDRRTAAELLVAAQLAQVVGELHGKELALAAAEKEPADPGILMGAYLQAAAAGWEEDAAAGTWLRRAAELSGRDGPLQQLSMKEFFDRKPEWDKLETSIWQLLNEGKVPMFGAAHLLRRSLIDFTLLQALANLKESDTRRRGVVYAFSGARPADICPLGVATIALDLTAIFTLALLRLLPVAIEAYQRIAIPHSTLGWLFQERQRAVFHQPSRVKRAHDFKRLIAEGALKILPSQPLTDLALAKEVGFELASLLTAASKAIDGISRYVIRSPPVHRIGSLMQEEADLSAHSKHLCSCQSLVEKLRAKGILTFEEEQRAMAYLKLHERRWPAELKIVDEAEIYLDGLATTYLQTVGLLGKLKAAGLVAYVTEDADKDANRLIMYENLSDQQLGLVEQIRKALSEGITSGRVRVVKSPAIGDEKILGSHPTFSVLGIEDAVDTLVVDDRFVNQHPFMEANNRRTPILSTVDLLEDLAGKGVISAQNVYQHRTYLRQAGFQFIPVTEKELLHHLADAPVNEGEIIETAELRAIRESLLIARMRKILQILAETRWLHECMRAVIRAIRGLWKPGADLDEAAIRAEWLLGLADVRGWAPSTVPGNERNFALFVHAAHVQSLTAPLDDIPDSIRDAYYTWIDTRLLQGLRDSEPEVFRWMVDRARELIVSTADMAVRQLEV